MTELEITGDRVFKVWWLLVWRAGAGAIICHLLIYGLDYVAPNLHSYARILEILGLLIWNIKVTGMALRKKYEDFRIVLVPIETKPPV